MKKFEFPLSIFSAAIVVFLFALHRVSHAIMVLTHVKAVTETTEKVKAMGSDHRKMLTSQRDLPTVIR